jgi:phosphate transport system permease protein
METATYNGQAELAKEAVRTPTYSTSRVSRFARAESGFRLTLMWSAIAMAVLLGGIFLTLLINARLSIATFGLGFVSSTAWNPVEGQFGALPFLVGTLLTSLMAVGVSIPFSLGIALFLGEYFKRGAVPGLLRSMVELMAGIPSVIYGFWALFFMVPHIREFEVWLSTIGEPFGINIAPYGVGILSASLVLAVMVIPYSASVAREVISMVPNSLKEAAYSLGATRLEVISGVVLPYARSGIFAGVLLSLGRALGETMAVTMVIGNRNALPTDIFSPGNTMASIIANEFTEATDQLYLSSLLQIGLWLFVVSTVINIIGKIVIDRTAHS